jgi:uroporphyrin-III C-methyltransferase
MSALHDAGIAVEVVSGITAGIGAPATLGIPLTHRGVCEGVTFVTGHTGDGRQPDWRALAASHTTLVIYMGVAQIRSIVAALIDGGLKASTPAAAIQNGTLPSQQHVIATLATLPAEMQRASIASPALIVIGDVVRFAHAAQTVSELEHVA